MKPLPCSVLVLLALEAPIGALSPEPTDAMKHQASCESRVYPGAEFSIEAPDRLSLDVQTSPCGLSVPFGNLITMNRIAELPVAIEMLTSPLGFDLDEDGQREFIIRVLTNTPFGGGRFEFYENTGDNVFAFVHVIEVTVEDDPTSSDVTYHAGDVGDSDNDGLIEVVLFGRAVGDHHVRVYESQFAGAFPTELVWELGGDFQEGYGVIHDVDIADTDNDGWKEIVVADRFVAIDRLIVYENDGDDSYHATFSDTYSFGIEVQSMSVLGDIDDDGKDEILVGGLPPDESLIAYEFTADDFYEVSWIWVFDPIISVSAIVDVGDLDGDGKKEFLAGGLKPNSPLQTHIHLFETVADDEVQIEATFVRPGFAGASSANVADVDGDGTKEIIVGTISDLAIYKRGGFGWTEIWSESGLGPVASIGVGDHDGDGKDEIIVQDGEYPNGVTAIYEIDSADAADMDRDGVVDVVDNCPATANSGQGDADTDSVGDACDNCFYGPNPAQGAAIFGHAIKALDSQTFIWPEPAEVVYVTGQLALVDAYTVDVTQAMPLGTSLVDSSAVLPGEGRFYLVRPNCAVGSWQTSLGSEPERDLALP